MILKNLKITKKVKQNRSRVKPIVKNKNGRFGELLKNNHKERGELC
jgi:hypothetical protein